MCICMYSFTFTDRPPAPTFNISAKDFQSFYITIIPLINSSSVCVNRYQLRLMEDGRTFHYGRYSAYHRYIIGSFNLCQFIYSLQVRAYTRGGYGDLSDPVSVPVDFSGRNDGVIMLSAPYYVT